MNYPMMNHRNEKGFILVWVVIVILLLTIMGAGLLRLCAMEAVLVVNEVQRLKAFNLAEAGLERALWKFADDPPWTDGWQDQALGDGTYSVAVAAAPEVGEGWFRITSSGTAGDVSKTLALEVKATMGWPAALGYGIFWANPTSSSSDLEIRGDTTINSDVFAYGDVDVESDAQVINGRVYSTGTVTGSGQYTVGELPGTLPEKVTLDTSYYDALIVQADQEAGGDWQLEDEETYYLNGQTLLVNGKVKIEDDARLYGPGKIVATDNIEIKNDAVVSGGVDLISGKDLKIKDDASYQGTGSIVFASRKLKIEKDASVQDNVMVLTPSELRIKDNATVRGVLWGQDNTHLHQNKDVHIVGVIYAGEFHYGHGIGGDGHKDFSFVHDSSVLDATPPPGIPTGDDDDVVNLVLGRWSEE